MQPAPSLTFLGAARTVTGSKYLLTIGERRILIDAGLFQGEKEWRRKNWEDFPVPPDTITDIVLTHAHLDHQARPTLAVGLRNQESEQIPRGVAPQRSGALELERPDVRGVTPGAGDHQRLGIRQGARAGTTPE